MVKKVLNDEWNDPNLKYRVVCPDARFSFREEKSKIYDKSGEEVE